MAGVVAVVPVLHKFTRKFGRTLRPTLGELGLLACTAKPRNRRDQIAFFLIKLTIQMRLPRRQFR